jgi:hypothetical protein
MERLVRELLRAVPRAPRPEQVIPVAPVPATEVADDPPAAAV